MRKPGEISIQSFSLPLTFLPNDCEKSDPDTSLEVVIKYRLSELARTHTIHKTDEVDLRDHVCLSIEVVRACGLKV